MRDGRRRSAILLRVLVPVLAVIPITAATAPARSAVTEVVATVPHTSFAAPPQLANPVAAPAELTGADAVGDRSPLAGSGLAWLDEINLYRIAAGLPPVVEDPALTAGLHAHFTYLTHTPPNLMTGPYANVHTENPASPYYTVAGDAAARSSNLSLGYDGPAVGQIDGWLLAPFHVVGILRPGLARVGFAQDPNSSWAGLNVGSGLTSSGPPSAPVLFPGPGISTDLTTWLVNEVPNPLETCGWQSQFPGPALVAMLPANPVAGLTATLVADSGPDFSTAAGTLCVVDMHTYVSADPVYGPTGASILSGNDHPVFLIPQTPLTWSRYRATIKQTGKPDIAWSFVGTPPRQPLRSESVVLHVTDTGADTVFGNLTVTGPSGPGYTTVYPCLEAIPNASNNNFLGGQTIPNLVAAHPDSNGDICLYTTTPAHLIWDQVAETDAFTSHTPTRLVDTRLLAKLPNSGVQVVHVTDNGAETVIGNLTVTGPTGQGYTTVYPCLEAIPNASNNNFLAGETIPNLVVAHPDTNGDICLYTTTSAHLIWDQVAETDAFPSHTPTRLMDTRLLARLPDNGVQVVHVKYKVADNVFGNLTVTGTTGQGYTTVYPCLEGRPHASNNNFLGGQTIPNLVVAKPDSNGDICLYTTTSAHLIWDQVVETDAFSTYVAERLIDTRIPAGRL